MPFDLSAFWQSYRDLFKKTSDLRYVALAIGQRPTDPPKWAVRACRQVYEDYQIEVARFDEAKGRARKYSKEDGRLLVRVAELTLDGKSKTAAIKEVTGEDADGPKYKRLLRAWNEDLRPERIVAPERPVLTNRWLNAAHARRHAEWTRRAFEQAVREIEAGDLDTTIDPEAQAQREKKARWFVLRHPSAGPNDPPQLKIKLAPFPSFEDFVKLMKRYLLNPDDEKLDEEEEDIDS